MKELDEREEELASLTAIFPELVRDGGDAFVAFLDIAVTPARPLLVRFVPTRTTPLGVSASYADVAAAPNAYIEHDVELSHLPPLCLRMDLPQDYPLDAPPTVQLHTKQAWLPQDKLTELESELPKLWDEYGRCQILFTYIDFLQQSVERGFDLDHSREGCLVLSTEEKQQLVAFNECTKKEIFNAGTYDCGVCLYPKSGSACHQLERCGHVFCRQCLQDYFNSAITEGDVASIQCLSPDCGKEKSRTPAAKSPKSTRALQPRQLLAMGIEEPIVRRYVELRRSKRMVADQSTVYCPRTWCQGPAKSAKYPLIPANLSTYIVEDLDEQVADGKDPNADPSKDQSPAIPPNPADRLAICEKCQLAFCKVCFLGWHGPFARCYPRDPNQLSAEDQASYAYIREKTSPCPTCACPVQKSRGCNHMTCVVCRSHFCYLCGAWLSGDNPYPHFNKPGTQCYQRIWEADADEGEGPGGPVVDDMDQHAIEAARDAEAQEAALRLREEEERVARVALRVVSAQGDE